LIMAELFLYLKKKYPLSISQYQDPTVPPPPILVKWDPKPLYTMICAIKVLIFRIMSKHHLS